MSKVNVDDLENKSLRLDQALQGMVAGVTVTQNGGAPGAAPSIHIRGVGLSQTPNRLDHRRHPNGTW